MEIERLSETVLLVNLPPEPGTKDILQMTISMIQKNPSSVILSFSRINIFTSRSIQELLKLRKCLIENACQLLLCRVEPSLSHTFVMWGIDGVFDIVDDEHVAMVKLS